MMQQSESSCLLRNASKLDLMMACSHVLIEAEHVRMTLRDAGEVARHQPNLLEGWL